MKIQFFIHVGPPKTGTSAIQKWMNDNTLLLEQNGIYYPKHNTDKNGVSSGNLLSIYSRKTDGTLYLDETKVSNLYNDLIKNNKFSKVFLSSEFFFIRMAEIKKAIPSAVFFCYVRNPMEKRESLYNQGVKRSYFTKKYPINKSKKIPELLVYIKFFKKYGIKDLVITPYNTEYLHRGSILSDVLKKLNVDIPIEYKSTNLIINPSYQLEALEVKRWLNNFSIKNIHSDIDTCLQSYSKGTSSYSLIKPSLYKKQKTLDIRKIRKFYEKIDAELPVKFIRNIKNSNQRPYHKQSLEETQILSVFTHMYEELSTQGDKLQMIIQSEITNTDCVYYASFQRVFMKKRKKSILKTLDNFTTALRQLNEDSAKPNT